MILGPNEITVKRTNEKSTPQGHPLYLVGINAGGRPIDPFDLLHGILAHMGCAKFKFRYAQDGSLKNYWIVCLEPVYGQFIFLQNEISVLAA
jgi:hypothetical protein